MTLLLTLSGGGSLCAQTGTNAYSFLEIPTSAHALALGGSGIAIIDDDVSLSDQNPALIGPEIDKQLNFNYMYYYGASNFAGARFGNNVGERGGWAAGIRYLNYGSMTGYDPNGEETGKFTPMDMVFEGSFSHDITDRLRGGVSLKVVYSNYEQYTAFAMAADLGLNYYNENSDFSLSLTLKNMGGQLKRFADSHDRLPFNIELGMMTALGSSPFSLAITATHLNRWKLPFYQHDKENPEKQQVLKSNFGSNLFRHLLFGLQYSPSDRFWVGLGYSYKVRTDMSTYHRSFLSGFSLGGGLKVKGFGVSVSYSQPHRSANTVMLNLSASFGEFMR